MQMDITNDQKEIRRRLTAIIEEQGKRELFNFEEKQRADEETSHKISELLQSDFKPYDIPGNCISYAFGLDSDNQYTTIARSYSNDYTPLFLRNACPYYASPDFIDFLIDAKILQETLACENVLAIYFDNNGRCTHVGLTTENARIQSKLGLLPGIHVHEAWEVPESYGEVIKYYVLPNTEDVLCYFKEFCKHIMKPSQTDG